MTPLADDPALVEAVARGIVTMTDGHDKHWKVFFYAAVAALRALQPHHDRIVREAQREAWDAGQAEIMSQLNANAQGDIVRTNPYATLDLNGPQPRYEPMETAPRGEWVKLWIMPEASHIPLSVDAFCWTNTNEWVSSTRAPLDGPFLGWSPITPTVTEAAYAQEQAMRDDVARRARVDAAKDAVVEAARDFSCLMNDPRIPEWRRDAEMPSCMKSLYNAVTALDALIGEAR